MKRLLILLLFLFPVPAISENSHAEFTVLLQQYVKEGEVNYIGLCKDYRLNEYINKLAGTDPDSLSDDKEKLAFWINVYNAYTLKVICDNYPVKSINDLHSGGRVLGHIFNTTIWDKDFVVINGIKMTLNHIEHEIIRPVFKDPRAHFALVCASKSCPPLREEAFEGFKLNEQLNDAARVFLNDSTRNQFDLEQKRAMLSKIFDWYGKDFGNNKKEILLYISRFLPQPAGGAISEKAGEWHISYLNYNWSLNGN